MPRRESPLARRDCGIRNLKHSKRKIFLGETFRVLKEKKEKQYGEYRTRRLVLEAWDKL
jgi:hypothetical protein